MATKRNPVQWRRRNPTSKPQEVNQTPIQYLLNDMTTPDLVKSVDPPKQPQKPPFTVLKYAGGGFAHGTKEALAAGCQVTICNVLDSVNKWVKRPLTNWPGTSNLLVKPTAGVDLNAYYDRRSLCFFYFGHKTIGGTVFTADSSDIVAHELGHALLDTFRPDTWDAALLEIWSFHEGFADLSSLLNIMSHSEILEYALAQTGGDMRKPNVISNLAEGVGLAIYKVVGPGQGRKPEYLRSAVNQFNYVAPKSLPDEAPNDKLAAEPHSFGRIMLGAFYDIIVGIYEATVAQGEPPLKALQHARNAVGRRVFETIMHAPLNARFYRSFAQTMLWANKNKFHGNYQNIIKKAFVDRNILPAQVTMLSTAPKCDNEEGIVRVQSKLHLKLSDHLIRAQANNPLYDVELEIPHEQVYLYDENKSFMDSAIVTEAEALDAAQDMIIYLNNTGKVGDGPDTPFEIKDGKLVRTHFA